MNYLGKLRLALPVFALAALNSCAFAKKEKEKENNGPLNIMVISVDDLTYNSIGAFGCKVKDVTPNIDRLAAEGTRFNYAYNNTAVSQPCRESWLTGVYPHNNGAEGLEPINNDIVTLPKLLKDAGYVNGILGKEMHHQPTENFCWDFIPYRTEQDKTWRRGESRNPKLFYEYAKKFFELADKENKPFFFSVNSHDPHRPFAGSAIDSAAWNGNIPPITKRYSPEEVEVFKSLPDIPDVRKEVAQYFTSVHRADQSIGAVMKALEESGRKDNTLVIFLSDHGASLPFAKAQCYLNSTRTPLIVRWPGKVSGGVVDNTHLISGVDLMPTILEAVGVETGIRQDGHSFLPLLLGRKDYKSNDYVFSAFYQIFARKRYPMRSLQNKEFMYIYNFWSDNKRVMTGDATGGLTWRAMLKAAKDDSYIAERVQLYKYRVKEEFYDLQNDPDALHNLIDKPEYSKKIEEFRKEMLESMKRYDDPAYETFKNRDNEESIRSFMEAQDAKAKKTRPNVKL